MVERHLEKRGIVDRRVLEAFRVVQREAFVPENLQEFAYQDAPLPIAEGQTISQPYIVALTVAALGLKGHERALEVGTGSGYAAAILGQLAKDVFSVERIESLATTAKQRLAALGYENVHVLHADGTLGWAEHAPYDAIAVAAGGPEVPRTLRSQLAIGGRLVIPVGKDESSQVLLRVTRVGPDEFREEALTQVRFVPLIGEQGWPEPTPAISAPAKVKRGAGIQALIRETAEPVDSLESTAIDGLVERMGDARRATRVARGVDPRHE